MNLYYCMIDEFKDMAGASLLPLERRIRIQRFFKEEDKLRCLTAGLMLGMALGDGSQRLKVNPQGKPYLPEGPQFNLSHSGRYVILGLSNHELGVDIERVEPFDDRVARRCYTAPELRWLYAQGDTSSFYKLWTAKESIMKAAGLGFLLPPESFSVLPVRAGKHEVCSRSWFLQWKELPDHAICTACAQEEEVRLIHVHREQLISQETPAFSGDICQREFAVPEGKLKR